MMHIYDITLSSQYFEISYLNKSQFSVFITHKTRYIMLNIDSRTFYSAIRIIIIRIIHILKNISL